MTRCINLKWTFPDLKFHTCTYIYICKQVYKINIQVNNNDIFQDGISKRWLLIKNKPEAPVEPVILARL